MPFDAEKRKAKKVHTHTHAHNDAETNTHTHMSGCNGRILGNDGKKRRTQKMEGLRNGQKDREQLNADDRKRCKMRMLARDEGVSD